MTLEQDSRDKTLDQELPFLLLDCGAIWVQEEEGQGGRKGEGSGQQLFIIGTVPNHTCRLSVLYVLALTFEPHMYII